AEDGIRDKLVTEFRRVLFRSWPHQRSSASARQPTRSTERSRPSKRARAARSARQCSPPTRQLPRCRSRLSLQPSPGSGCPGRESQRRCFESEWKGGRSFTGTSPTSISKRSWGRCSARGIERQRVVGVSHYRERTVMAISTEQDKD